MKFDIQDGWVVIPVDAAGAPKGVALRCVTSEQCAEVFDQEDGGQGHAYFVKCLSSSEAPDSGGESGGNRPKPSPKPRLVKAGPRHRVEDE